MEFDFDPEIILNEPNHFRINNMDDDDDDDGCQQTQPTRRPPLVSTSRLEQIYQKMVRRQMRLDPLQQQPISSSFIQPSDYYPPSVITNNQSLNSQSLKTKTTPTTSSSNLNRSSSSIDGMANLTPSLVQFQAQQQQMVQQHTTGSTNNRSRAKNRASNSSNLNGLPAQQIFGTSVAFPGQSGSGTCDNYQQSSRLNEMQQQQQSAAGQTLLLPINQGRNLNNNSNAAAAVAAAVANAHHPQYSQYSVSSWPCPACKISFRSANELQTHLSAHFGPSQNPKSLQNQVTNQTRQDQGIHLNKKDNMPDNGKSVPCTECGKLFANAERVRVHVRVSHGEKTCSCSICGSSFSYRCKLLNHMRTHTGDKPFTCEVCGRSFSQKNHLKRHHMIHTGERPFPCEICGRAFYRKDKLTRHLRIHTNPSPRTMRSAANRMSSSSANVNQSANNNSSSVLKIPNMSTAVQLLPVPMTTQLKNASPSTSANENNSAIGGQTPSVWTHLQSSPSPSSSNNQSRNKSDLKEDNSM